MKRHYISLLIILVLSIAVIYLWYQKESESEVNNMLYDLHLSKDIEFLTTTLMLNSIPDTFELYSNDFTETELETFRNSLNTIIIDLSVASANIKNIEDIDERDNMLSGSIEEIYKLFFEIQEDAKNIDEDVFFEISEIAPEYSRKLNDIFYRSPNMENIYEEGPDALEDMIQEIEELIKKN